MRVTADQSLPESAACEILESLVRQAEESGASDLHLQMDGNRAQVCFRLDAVMTPVRELEHPVAERVVGRIKFLARLKTYQESLPQDGRIAGSDLGIARDIRVSTYPAITGEKIVLRLFALSSGRSLRELNFPPKACAELEGFLRRNAGLLLLTGPAGSGKTTTIYACLRFLASLPGRHIITVEDPVEQIVPGIMQTEVNEARGLTFSVAARHLLRQDPQVLVIGEIRDEETARIAVRAALTGHLVIATLHAGSCQGVFERLLEMGDDPRAALSVIGMILNQRLVRRVCATCHGAGCGTCLWTGYKGLTPLLEWLTVDDALRETVRRDGARAARPAASIEAGMRELIREGVTNRAESERIFGA